MEDVDGGSTAGCAGTLSLSKSSFTCENIGLNEVILSATTINANTATCSSIVTVIDTFAPTAVCNNIDAYLDATGNVSITGEDLDGGSSDNCDALTFSLSQTDFTCDDVGANSVTLIVSDAGGNTSTCIATVNVIDNIAPTARCKNRTISLEDNGLETISASAIDNNSWDACGIRSISIKPNSFSKSDIGVNTVVLTVVDNSGNVSTCKSTVTVIDITPPSVVCNTADFVIVSNGQYEFTQADIDALAAGTSDNVNAFADLVISVEPMVLTCDNVGGTTVTVYASDEAGNTDSCTVQVGVTALSAELGLDSIQDVMVDEDTTLIVSLTGITGNVCTAENPILTASSDNSDLINSLTVNYTSGNTNATIDVDLLANESGTATITVVLEDGNGNEVAESFILTVKPVNDSPVLVTELQDMEMKTNETLTLELSKVLGVLFDDVDDSTLVYSLTFDGGELPVWVTAMEDDNAITLGFEPLLSDTGCYNIVVEAQDMMGEIASASFKLCVSPVIVGINDLDETLFEVTMYPNPTKGQVTIKHEIAFAREVEVAVMNIAGSEVFRKKYFSSDPIQFDLSDEVSGMYIVNIKIDEHHFIRKLILDRK